MPDDSDDNRALLLRITAVVALGGFLFGYDTGVIGGTQLYFTEYFAFSPSEQGFAVAAALFGCLLGALVAGPLCTRYSRKFALIASAVLFTISALGSGLPETLTALALYRAIGGVGLGIASMAAPMYIAEVAPAAQRGRLVSLYQLAIVVGFFVVFLATYLIGGGSTDGMDRAALDARHAYNVSVGWRWMFWSELLPALLFLGLLPFVPHTPRWLLLHGRDEQAERVLERLQPGSAAAVAAQIRTSLAGERDLAGLAALRALLQPGLRRALMLGVGLSVFQQITGINAILYYGAEIFSSSLGYGTENALEKQMLLGGVNLLFTFVAIAMVDRWGRRPLLLVGLLAMFTGLALLSATIFFERLGWLSLIGMLGFIGAFALSMGPVTWVLLSEIFPNHVRSTALSLAVAVQWFCNGLVAQLFPMLNRLAINDRWFHGSLPFALFALLCLVALAFVIRLAPETRGRSLEDLARIWRRPEAPAPVP